MFGDAPLPTWTTKEVLTVIFSIVGVLFGAAVSVIVFLLGRERSIAKEASEKEIRELTEKIKLLEEGNGVSQKQDLVEMLLKVEEAEKEAEALTASKAAVEAQMAEHKQHTDSLKGDLVKLKTDLVHYQEKLDGQNRRIDRALRKDGQTWTEKVRSNAPEFKALQVGTRRMPIVSVLNLKGGVGKTTITANLGAALDQMGYRALLLDLDLQGSLTSLFLSESDQEKIYKDEKLLGDFLASSFGAEYPNLQDFAQPILEQSALVATTDQLAYAETNLTIRWLLREEGNRDPRFLLRRELQLKRITGNYDIVLLDCPPLINVTCVNALAASDYVLIPILPSKQATARVPILLSRLKELREEINSELNVLGIVANRTHWSELTIDEQNRLSALKSNCRDIWGSDVPLFDTFIRQNVEMRVAEDDHRPLTPNDEMFAAFLELAREVEHRLPTFCQPPLEKKMAKEAVS